MVSDPRSGFSLFSFLVLSALILAVHVGHPHTSKSLGQIRVYEAARDVYRRRSDSHTVPFSIFICTCLSAQHGISCPPVLRLCISLCFNGRLIPIDVLVARVFCLIQFTAVLRHRHRGSFLSVIISLSKRRFMLTDAPVRVVFVSLRSQFKALWSTLLITSGGCKQLEYLTAAQVVAMVQEIRRILADLVRLASVDPTLSPEPVFVANLEAGVEHSMLGGRADVAAMYVHDELMSASEAGRRVDMNGVVKKLSGITKFLQGPKGGARRHPLDLAHGSANDASSAFPAAGWSSVQHGSGNRGGGGGRGRQALCNACRSAGKSGADIAHSYKNCPLVTCNGCGINGHIRKFCPTNP